MDSDNRFCQSCKHDHGPLYICESYSDDLKRQLAIEGDAFRRAVRDPAWQAEQIANGVPKEIVLAAQLFAGD